MIKKRIATLGGGSGSNAVLKGLVEYDTFDITALVTMADDGGSTGVLRDEMKVQSVGDARQAVAALALGDEEIRRLFQYRFHDGPCKGHSLGNVMLAAGEQLFGSFEQSITALSRMLQVQGRVVPITNDNPRIVATLSTGEKIIGEGEIYTRNYPRGEKLSIAFTNTTRISDAARDALTQADAVVITPGTYYCTLMPVLMVEGVSEVLSKRDIPIIIVLNCLNRKGHTEGWKASDYVAGLEHVLRRSVTHILMNSEPLTHEQIVQYDLTNESGLIIEDDLGGDMRVHRKDVLSQDTVHRSSTDVLAVHRAFIRHDPSKVAKVITALLHEPINF